VERNWVERNALEVQRALTEKMSTV